MLRTLAWTVVILAIFGIGLWAQNSSWLRGPSPGRMTLLAHRGVHQTFDHDGVDAQTCTASRIGPPTHAFLENTLASMEEAFRVGAEIVEFDIHPTTDGQFAVIHDWTLDCRTEGHGVTREHSLAELKALDVGYGYTADGGRTFPFRGKGVGAMPSLDEVLARFPDKRFLINIKSNDPAEGDLLAARLARLSRSQRALLAAYGGDKPIAHLRSKLPDIPVMSKASLKRCFLTYAALGWAGYVPQSCRNTVLLLPINIAPWIWGYPNRLVARMEKAGTRVFITGPYDGGDFTGGIDSAALLADLPETFRGGVWTNRIELIGPLKH